MMNSESFNNLLTSVLAFLIILICSFGAAVPILAVWLCIVWHTITFTQIQMDVLFTLSFLAELIFTVFFWLIDEWISKWKEHTSYYQRILTIRN